MAGPDAQRFGLLTPEDLGSLPDPIWRIDRVLPANSLCVLYGEPGCGKTFVALSMALSIAAGHSWCGKPTKPGLVLYVAAEGLFGLKLRVQAYQSKHDITASNIRYLGAGFDLRNAKDIERVLGLLQAAGFQPDLIILDTLARLIPGADENSAQDMGLAIAAIDRLRAQTSATVLLVHHTVKGGKTERGSSALRGAADVMIECSRAESTGLVSLKCGKMKDAEPFPKANLGLQRVTLGPSAASLAVADWQDALEAGANTAAANKALQVLDQKFGPDGASNKDWQEAYIAETGQSKPTFVRALRKLKNEGAVRHDGKTYVPIRKGNGIKCHEVSTQCHDTSHEGVMSPPPLGGDTDTAGQRTKASEISAPAD